MSEWTDEYIHQHFDDLVDEFVPDPGNRPWGYASDVWRLLAFEMRDDLQARIAELKQELREQGWQLAEREIELEAVRKHLQSHAPVYDDMDRWLYGEGKDHE